MELDQLRDFLSLVEEGSFSRAARRRNVTQPAFSRRIRALESWVGLDLFDRRIQPARLTVAGQRFRIVAEDIVRQIDGLPARLRDAGDGPGFVCIAAQHALATAYVPEWIARAQAAAGPLRARVVSSDLQGCHEHLQAGACDFAMVFHHQRFPAMAADRLVSTITLGQTLLSPYAAPDGHGQPQHALPEAGPITAPLLIYPPAASLAHVLDEVFDANRAAAATVICENALADALRTLAVAGQGVAWLPDILAAPDVAQGRLVSAGCARWRARLEIRMHRREDRISPASRRLWHAFARHALAA